MAVGRIDSNELLQLRLLALDAAANAVVITDRDGLIVWVNQAFTRLTGFAADEAAGRTPTILKSGVIDGMAYTLYTDGSIEAELPQGTLRFGSLEELRDYLAGNT